jgi:hypothetical protein
LEVDLCSFILAQVVHAEGSYLLNGLKILIGTVGSCVIFNLNNKTIFAPKPSPYDLYQPFL